MNVLDQFMRDREDGQRGLTEADERWMLATAGIDPAERLLAWDRWLRGELERRLSWPNDAVERARLVGQCGAEITALARQLRGRGWLLDGKALAEHVRALLAPIAEAQKAGKIGRFWPYFLKAVRTYVGSHAEEISAHARRTGASESGQAVGTILAGLGLGGGQAKPAGPSLTELLAARCVEVGQEKLRASTARLRREQSRAEAEAAQIKLL